MTKTIIIETIKDLPDVISGVEVATITKEYIVNPLRIEDIKLTCAVAMLDHIMKNMTVSVVQDPEGGTKHRLETRFLIGSEQARYEKTINDLNNAILELKEKEANLQKELATAKESGQCFIKKMFKNKE